MLRAALVAVVVSLAVPTVASARPVIHSDTRDVRACLPLPGGGALVGTGGGLLHVDATGAVRATWTAVDGLPGTRVEALVADPSGDGAIWLGADRGGARVRLADGALTVERTVAARPFRDVAVHDGRTYAATWEGGVVAIDGRGRPRALAWKGRSPAARQRVSAVASQGGTLWAGTAAGLYALRGARLERVAIAGASAEPAVTGLLADGERLWIATAAGLFVREADRARLVGPGDLRRVVDLDGAVATAGLGDGVRVLDRGRLAAPAGGPSLAIAQALASTADGAACAGGVDGLWLRAAGGAWRPVALAGELPSNDVSALAVDGERLWVGMFDRGLVVREGGTWRPVTHPELDLRINALLVEPRGDSARLWVATAAGLMTLDGGEVARLTRRDGLPGRGVLSLARLRDGRVIAGTTTGAAVVGDGRALPIGPPAVGNVWAVAEDADGLLWLGTTTGVWRGPATAAGKGVTADGWQRYSVATGHLRDDWVMAIAPRGRAVWVGSYKGGVVRFDLPAASTSTAPSAAAPAPAPLAATHLGDAWINPGGLVWDGDRLIASTQDGLRTGDGRTARWSTAAGLPGKDVTAYARAGTTRWIATRRGLVEDR